MACGLGYPLLLYKLSSWFSNYFLFPAWLCYWSACSPENSLFQKTVLTLSIDPHTSLPCRPHLMDWNINYSLDFFLLLGQWALVYSHYTQWVCRRSEMWVCDPVTSLPQKTTIIPSPVDTTAVHIWGS